MKSLPSTAKDLYIRDVPRNCICDWYWYGADRKWVMFTPESDCPWHLTQNGRLHQQLTAAQKAAHLRVLRVESDKPWHKTTQPRLPRALYARLDV